MDQLPLGQEELLRVGRMIRQIHDASEAVSIPNPSTWKMLLGPAHGWWDLAYSAQSFSLLFDGELVEDAALRLRSVVDGYEADAALRTGLPAAMANTGEQPPNTSHGTRKPGRKLSK